MNLKEAGDAAAALATTLEEARTTIESVLGQVDGDLAEFVRGLHGMMVSNQSGHAAELTTELQSTLATAIDAVQEAKDKADPLVGCLTTMLTVQGTYS